MPDKTKKPFPRTKSACLGAAVILVALCIRAADPGDPDTHFAKVSVSPEIVPVGDSASAVATCTCEGGSDEHSLAWSSCAPLSPVDADGSDGTITAGGAAAPAGTFSLSAACQGGGDSATLTVVKVKHLACEGRTSASDSPSATATVVVAVGAAGATVAVTATPEPGPWPANWPRWNDDSDSTDGKASIDWPIDVVGDYMVTATCGTSSVSIRIMVVTIVEILVKPIHNPDGLDWAASATIAAGGHASAPHRADVKLRLEPVPPVGCAYSVALPVALVNAGGYNGGNDAVLDILGTGGTVAFDSADGIEYGTLTSSDVARGTLFGGPCQIDGGPVASISFAPFDNVDWSMQPPYIVSNGNSEHELVFTWKGAHLEGHDIRMYVEKVTYKDAQGVEQQILNTAAAPDAAAVAPCATYAPTGDITDSAGKIASTLWTAADVGGDEWIGLRLVAYDFSARKTDTAPVVLATILSAGTSSAADERTTAPNAEDGGLPVVVTLVHPTTQSTATHCHRYENQPQRQSSVGSSL